MKKSLYCLIGVLLLCFSLTSCSTETSPDAESNKGTVDASEAGQSPWESFLSSIQGEDIGYPSWSIYKENPTNDELAQYLQNAAACSVDSSEKSFGNAIWTLEMYVDAPPDDELNYDHNLRLEAGFQENLVCIQGGNAFPEGKFYTDDSELYWLVRSVNDSDSSIDEAALSAYQDTIDQYIADEQSRIANPSVKVELSSVKKQLERDDIGVKVFSIGTVLTSDSPEELLEYLSGGGYFDSELRLHPDGNSAMPNMLVVNETPVGFLSWEALDEIESNQDFNSGEELMNNIKNNKAWFTSNS